MSAAEAKPAPPRTLRKLKLSLIDQVLRLNEDLQGDESAEVLLSPEVWAELIAAAGRDGAALLRGDRADSNDRNSTIAELTRLRASHAQWMENDANQAAELARLRVAYDQLRVEKNLCAQQRDTAEAALTELRAADFGTELLELREFREAVFTRLTCGSGATLVRVLEVIDERASNVSRIAFERSEALAQLEPLKAFRAAIEGVFAGEATVLTEAQWIELDPTLKKPAKKKKLPPCIWCDEVGHAPDSCGVRPKDATFDPLPPAKTPPVDARQIDFTNELKKKTRPPRRPSRPTKKFPLQSGLTEKCTVCGAELGEHTGTKCPIAVNGSEAAEVA